ncbi:hypothetical protein [Mesorhizobium sp. SP-1A]|jgi:hypothetical protein|uniref:hypothetical protein n=1 Tax=Mesorhizobium sp. SP-1A TaxID=3077840 RepID=UPI0028F721F0|nr:hypothetical protein [Mesorhizobium sp. SP-1A]
MNPAVEIPSRQRAILTKATNEFCRKYEIKDLAGRAAAARLAMIYFRSGKRTTLELKHALESDE